MKMINIETTSSQSFSLARHSVAHPTAFIFGLSKTNLLRYTGSGLALMVVAAYFSIRFVIGFWSTIVPITIVAFAIALIGRRAVAPTKRSLLPGFAILMGQSLAAMCFPLLALLVRQPSMLGGVISVTIGLCSAMLALWFFHRPSWMTVIALVGYHLLDLSIITLGSMPAFVPDAGAMWGGLAGNLFLRGLAGYLLYEGIRAFDALKPVKVRVTNNSVRWWSERWY